MPALQHVAIIDLGSNTARVVVISARPGHAYRLEDEIREVVRLRQGMTEAGLAPDAVARGFATLRLFKRFCDGIGADPIIATATSAVRDAANGPQFVQRVQAELGLTLRVLDGEREAYYDTIGALNDVALSEGAILDIGGGSAQICRVVGRRYVNGQSAPIGALALTDRLVKHDPISDSEYKAVCDAEIEAALDQFTWLPAVSGQLVGLGGTIRNMARIEAERQDYPLSTLHGFELTLASVQESIRLFRTLPLSKRLKVPGLRSDRADIILGGALVIQAVMERLQVDRLTVSINGLREGLFYEYFWGHLVDPVIADIRSFGVLNLARIYGYQKTHANHVRFLAGRMFDQLFDNDSSKLKEKMKEVLKKAMPVYSKSLLGNRKVADKISAIEIVGFASPTYKGKYVDPQNLSSDETKTAIDYNLDLSYGRARAIFQYVFDEKKLNFDHQKDMLPLIKVTGRSFLAEKLPESRVPASTKKGDFCATHDCKKAQRVIIRFSFDDKK